jgi:predicted acyltransferase (DUF342 family)
MELAAVQVLLIDRLKDKEAECTRAHEANAALRAANDSLAAENRALRDAVSRQREGERSVAAQQAQLSGDMAALVARLEEVETVKTRFEVTNCHTFHSPHLSA